MSRDDEELRRTLESVSRHALALRSVVADLHVLAYERTVDHDVDKVSTSGADYALDHVGDQFARKLYLTLVRRAKEADDILAGLHSAAFNHLSVGSAEPSRGSLVSAKEHDRLVQNQRRREARGEYTPQKMVPQPSHPGKNRS